MLTNLPKTTIPKSAVDGDLFQNKKREEEKEFIGEGLDFSRKKAIKKVATTPSKTEPSDAMARLTFGTKPNKAFEESRETRTGVIKDELFGSYKQSDLFSTENEDALKHLETLANQLYEYL